MRQLVQNNKRFLFTFLIYQTTHGVFAVLYVLHLAKPPPCLHQPRRRRRRSKCECPGFRIQEGRRNAYVPRVDMRQYQGPGSYPDAGFA